MTSRVSSIAKEVLHTAEHAPECEYHCADAAMLSQKLCDIYAGQVQLVYLDPPFQTGKTFEMRLRVGEKEWRTGHGTLTLPAYDDNLPRDEYMRLMREVLSACKTLLSPSGLIFVHIDWRMHPYIRLLMDDLFGEDNFLNEIIWTYHSGGHVRRYFPRKHDVILMYSKTQDYDFHIEDVAEPTRSERTNHMRRHVDADGRVYRSIRSGGRVYTYYDDDPVPPDDVWSDISHLQQKDPQRTGYDTQKPLKLLHRIIKCASRPGDIVLDVFSGSGTTLEAAQQLGRRFIGADISGTAMMFVRRRTQDAACTFYREPCAGEPVCKATVDRGVAFMHFRLDSYQMEEGACERTFDGLDAVDMWAAGYERDGVFHVYAQEIRTHEHPALTGNLEVPVYDGQMMLRVTDVLGRDFFYLVTA